MHVCVDISSPMKCCACEVLIMTCSCSSPCDLHTHTHFMMMYTVSVSGVHGDTLSVLIAISTYVYVLHMMR